MTHPRIEAWLRSAAGRAMNPDGRYGLQCVDAADLYAQEIFGVPWEQCVGGVGGANELLDRVPDEYWIRTDNDGSVDLIPSRGDVVVWGGDGSNRWGHVAIVSRADALGVDVVQQDGFALPHQFVDGNWYSAKPAHTARLGYSQAGTGYMIGWLTPRPNKIKPVASVVPATSVTPIPIPSPAPPKGSGSVMAAPTAAANARGVWHARIPQNKGDKNFPAGTDISAEALLFNAARASENGAKASIATQKQVVAMASVQRGLVGAIAAIQKGELFDEVKLFEGVQAAAAKGIIEGMSTLPVEGTLDLTIGGKS